MCLRSGHQCHSSLFCIPCLLHIPKNKSEVWWLAGHGVGLPRPIHLLGEKLSSACLTFSFQWGEHHFVKIKHLAEGLPTCLNWWQFFPHRKIETMIVMSVRPHITFIFNKLCWLLGSLISVQCACKQSQTLERLLHQKGISFWDNDCRQQDASKRAAEGLTWTKMMEIKFMYHLKLLCVKLKLFSYHFLYYRFGIDVRGVFAKKYLIFWTVLSSPFGLPCGVFTRPFLKASDSSYIECFLCVVLSLKISMVLYEWIGNC